MTSRTAAMAAWVVATAACGSASSSRAPANANAAERGADQGRPATLEAECWLGRDRCVIELDLDGDGRADRVETVRQLPCALVAPEDVELADDGTEDRPCKQGLTLTLASGSVAQVGAGQALAAPATADDTLEPLALDDDLGFLRLLAVSHREDAARVRWNRGTGPAACDGDGLVVTGGDAAAVLCWSAGGPAAYHLGF